MIFNPFEHINRGDIKKRVEKLKKKNPSLSREDLCRLIIRNKCKWCAGAGAVTALPGAVPGVGTLVAIIGGTALDIAAMGYFTSEMILEIAAIHNRDLYISGTSREAVWVMVSAVGASAAGKSLTGVTVAQLSGRAFVSMLEKALLAIGIKATQRTILRVIPFAGMLITGAVNYYTCKKVGEYVAKYYSTNSYSDDWDGKTIDSSGSTYDE